MTSGRTGFPCAITHMRNMGFSQLISVKNLPHLDIKSILTLLLEYPVKACLQFNLGLQLEAQREKNEKTHMYIYMYIYFLKCVQVRLSVLQTLQRKQKAICKAQQRLKSNV